ncbi:MAG TPA: ribonuclease E/G, partial [Clostridiaceae bacterium]|nr:ribonuclease E/G [Clostridiaceae bacterium]
MKEIIIEENELRRIAIKEDGILTECHIETKEEKILPGNLILGVVKNTVFNLSSVFIDIGDT